MSPPASDLFEVQDIPNAGRGVIATQAIISGTVVLNSNPPAAHVVFRQYRKEVCAFCFEYDRGRTLPVRDNDVGKVFCSSGCQSGWMENERDLGVHAWRALHKFVQTKGKAITDHSSMVPIGNRPGLETIESTWCRAKVQIQPASLEFKSKKGSKKSNPCQIVDPDILGLFMSGLIYHHHNPDKWRDEVLSLAMDDLPYKSTTDLEAHTNSFIQLAGIVPPELLPSLNAGVCQVLTHAGSHNAFGIRSGSEDGEEYMGYSIYPAASYFNHSCNPNVFKKRLGRIWEFRTSRDINEGEQCCITYLGGDEEYLTVIERRARLMDIWGFMCTCSRCMEEQPL